MVVVRGRFYMNSWVDSQQRPRSTLEIEADSLGHDLAYGWSHFLRGTRSQSESAAGVNAGEMARQDIGSANLDATRVRAERRTSAATSTPATGTRRSRAGEADPAARPSAGPPDPRGDPRHGRVGRCDHGK